MNNAVENCVKSINKAKLLKNLNIIINDTYDLALKQAQQSEKRFKTG